MRQRYEDEKREQKFKKKICIYDIIVYPFMTEPLKYGFRK